MIIVFVNRLLSIVNRLSALIYNYFEFFVSVKKFFKSADNLNINCYLSWLIVTYPPPLLLHILYLGSSNLVLELTTNPTPPLLPKNLYDLDFTPLDRWASERRQSTSQSRSQCHLEWRPAAQHHSVVKMGEELKIVFPTMTPLSFCTVPIMQSDWTDLGPIKIQFWGITELVSNEC